MKITVIKELIKGIAREDVHIPLLLTGTMGVGKTWSVNEAAQEMNYCFIDLRLATQEPGDIIGLPRTKDSITFWTKPEWFPDETTPKGILFLDELNRAPLDVRQAVFQLVGDRRLHTHELPEGWIIVAATNPDNGEYQVESLDIAMLRRFCQIKVTPDVNEWIRWGDDYGIDKRILKFIKNNKKFLHKNEEFEITAYPSPEGYRMCDQLLSLNVIPQEHRHEVFSGLVGVEAATELELYLETEVEDCVPAADILENYKDVKNKVMEQSEDRMYKTIEEFVIMLESPSKTISKQSQLKNFCEFLRDLKEEYKFSLLTGIKSNVELIKKLAVADRSLVVQLQNIMKEVNN